MRPVRPRQRHGENANECTVFCGFAVIVETEKTNQVLEQIFPKRLMFLQGKAVKDNVSTKAVQVTYWQFPARTTRRSLYGLAQNLTFFLFGMASYA
jgi:hypothetical protein